MSAINLFGLIVITFFLAITLGYIIYPFVARFVTKYQRQFSRRLTALFFMFALIFILALPLTLLLANFFLGVLMIIDTILNLGVPMTENYSGYLEFYYVIIIATVSTLIMIRLATMLWIKLSRKHRAGTLKWLFKDKLVKERWNSEYGKKIPNQLINGSLIYLLHMSLVLFASILAVLGNLF